MNSIEQHLLMAEMENVLHQAERALKNTVVPARAVTYKDTIIIGDPNEPLYTFDDGHIKALSLVTGVDVVGSELSVDQLTPTVLYFSGTILRLWAPKGYQGLKCSDGRLFVYRVPRPDLRKLPYGTPVRYYRNDALVGLYYSLSVDRTARDFYRINSVSPIGLLDKTQHLGGIYHGETFGEVLADIIGGVVPFTCSPDVANLKIYNWLPIASRRSNLHQLVFAYGVSVLRDANGNMYFDYLSAGDPKAVPDGRIYYGGSVDYSTPATGVEVTEHSYSPMPDVTPVTLFDNTESTVGANNTFVSFNQAPVFDLAATGNLQIVSSGVNWAIVTGVGALTGKPYTHTTKVISLTAPDAGQRETNIVRVTDATLVNLTNSRNVAKRVMDYYSSAKTISAALSLEGESAGDQVSLSDPFGEPSTGFLQRLEINVSSNLKASCTIVTDYTPTPERPNFTHVDILSGEGDYTVPDGVYLLRIAMLQGGQGGSKGSPGQIGGPNKRESRSSSDERDVISWTGEGGEGGDPGAPGNPGKVYVIDIEVTPGQVFHFKAGVGGLGGKYADADGVGEEGTHSTFGQYSSASGSVYPSGWVEVLSGEVYATTGRPGIKGGNGSGCSQETGHPLVPGNSITVDGQTWNPGVSYRGQTWNLEYGSYRTGTGHYAAYLTGSQGGGAAYGADGGDGLYPLVVKNLDNDSAIFWGNRDESTGPGVVRWKTPMNTMVVRLREGGATDQLLWGGAGATASPLPAETIIGKGGPGGNGGGGAGAAASAEIINRYGEGITPGTSEFWSEPTSASGRSPGNGSDGSPGGPGGILVYRGDPVTPANTEEEESQ